jgi:hypothetical protein
MSQSDQLLVYQLLVLVLTFLVVGWYTIETNIIRRETSRQAVLTPSAKLWDRQNELDRMAVLKPKLVREFKEMANRQQPFFTAPTNEVARDDHYTELKGYVCLQLNFFEEIYITTSMSRRVEKRFEREEWNTFIFECMRHALLREVFNALKDRSYTGEFVSFMTKNEHRWQGEADSEIF